MSESSSTRRKKAVICGISYRGCVEEIEGCVNDAMFMKHLLKNKYNFSNIFMLTDNETNFLKIPTKKNIIHAMKWLVKDCQAGDSLVFFYSGHGSQEKDKDGDEIDGLDEAICPLDYRTNGMITDDEINEIMVRPLPTGVKLHAIIDSCHSGTMLDLPYLCKMNRKGHYHWEDQGTKNSVWKGTNGGEVFSFSGCDDHQKSIDTKELAKISVATGAMTHSFIKALEGEGIRTYGGLLNSLQSSIVDFEKKMDKKVGRIQLFGKLERMLQMNQVPQLTSNKTFDIYEKTFSL